jgi:hypothetical protein
MKQILTKAMMAVLLLVTFSCKKDNSVVKKETFSVEVKQNVALPLIITSKEEVAFDLTITSSSAVKIKNAVLSLNENSLVTANASADGTVINMQVTYKATSQDIGSSLIFRLIISDESGSMIDKDFVVYVQLAPADISIIIPANAPTEITDKELASFNIAVTSGNDLRYIKTFNDQTVISSLTKEVFSNANQDSYVFTYNPTVADADKTLSFTIEVMDVLGNIVKKTYLLKIKRSQAVDFITYKDVKLGAQKSADEGPFFNAANGEVYVTKGAAAHAPGIDFATFYSGSTNAYNIVSPSLSSLSAYIYTVAGYGADAISNWTVKNKTSIKKIVLTQVDYDLITSSVAIEALYTTSAVTASESSGGLTNGSVIVFKTAANRYGVMLVKDKSANANTGYLTVDVKIQ